MKNRLILTLAFMLTLCFSNQGKAQDSKVLVGTGLAYATDISNLGIRANGVYLMNDTWEFSPSFTYYLKKNYTNWSSLDFDGHYVFSSNDKSVIYGIGGLNLTFWKVKLNNSDLGVTDEYIPDFMGSIANELETKGSDFGLNIGIGSRFALSDKMDFNADLKYTLGGGNYLSVGVGLLFKL